MWGIGQVRPLKLSEKMDKGGFKIEKARRSEPEVGGRDALLNLQICYLF